MIDPIIHEYENKQVKVYIEPWDIKILKIYQLGLNPFISPTISRYEKLKKLLVQKYKL